MVSELRTGVLGLVLIAILAVGLFTLPVKGAWFFTSSEVSAAKEETETEELSQIVSELRLEIRETRKLVLAANSVRGELLDTIERTLSQKPPPPPPYSPPPIEPGPSIPTDLELEPSTPTDPESEPSTPPEPEHERDLLVHAVQAMVYLVGSAVVGFITWFCKRRGPVRVRETERRVGGVVSVKGAGTIQTWNRRIQKRVMRDLGITYPDIATRIRALWAMFDSEADVTSIILDSIQDLISESTGGQSLPPNHSNVTFEGKNVDMEALWGRVCLLLDDLVLEDMEVDLLPTLKGMMKRQDEDWVGFIGRCYLTFKSKGAPDLHAAMSVVLGKLPHGVIDKIMIYLDIRGHPRQTTEFVVRS